METSLIFRGAVSQGLTEGIKKSAALCFFPRITIPTVMLPHTTSPLSKGEATNIAKLQFIGLLSVGLHTENRTRPLRVRMWRSHKFQLSFMAGKRNLPFECFSIQIDQLPSLKICTFFPSLVQPVIFSSLEPTMKST